MNRYPGGKNAEGTWQWLVDRMPPHSLYVEPFLGSGGTLRRKIPALRSVGIDRDSEVVAHWKRVRFPGLSVVLGCGIEWLAEHVEALAGSDALVYCDPPYLLSTRVKRNLYRCEMSDADHRRLLDVLLALNCRIMLSGYASALYDRRLSGWRRAEREVMTRGGTWRTEILWENFDAVEVTDYALRAPGRDYRERERIKKRLARWRRKFQNMPDYERRAVLAELVRAEQRGEWRGKARPRNDRDVRTAGGP